MSLFGKISFSALPFPYTFPITFDTLQVGQVYDDTSEDWASKVHASNTFLQHFDVSGFLSDDVFPPDGIAPTTAGTVVVLGSPPAVTHSPTFLRVVLP
jgi:hypothetical protein